MKRQSSSNILRGNIRSTRRAQAGGLDSRKLFQVTRQVWGSDRQGAEPRLAEGRPTGHRGRNQMLLMG